RSISRLEGGACLRPASSLARSPSLSSCACRCLCSAIFFFFKQKTAYEMNAQGAETEFRKALEIDGNYLAAYSALGALFVNTNQQDRAIAEYQKIVERRPDNAATYTLIGMLEMNRQNIDAAVDYYRKALVQDE